MLICTYFCDGSDGTRARDLRRDQAGHGASRAQREWAGISGVSRTSRCFACGDCRGAGGSLRRPPAGYARDGALSGLATPGCSRCALPGEARPAPKHHSTHPILTILESRQPAQLTATVSACLGRFGVIAFAAGWPTMPSRYVDGHSGRAPFKPPCGQRRAFSAPNRALLLRRRRRATRRRSATGSRSTGRGSGPGHRPAPRGR
jgi:hypothetical protein